LEGSNSTEKPKEYLKPYQQNVLNSSSLKNTYNSNSLAKPFSRACVTDPEISCWFNITYNKLVIIKILLQLKS
jgi:hypothetical protein